MLDGFLPELELELTRDEGGLARAEVVQHGELLLLLLNLPFIGLIILPILLLPALFLIRVGIFVGT